MTLTISEITAREVGDDWDDEDDARWRGAARKYLATMQGRTYLVKPDIGWPSNRDAERIAAAYYRSLGQPVPNVVNATIGDHVACAVRIIDGADPIGDNFHMLSPTEARDVFRGLLLSTLIGDRDRHQYNWIHDGERAYAIDHGLSFAPNGYIRVPAFATEYVIEMIEAGSLTEADMRQIARDLPNSAERMAALAWEHMGSAGPDLSMNVREVFSRYIDALLDDYNSGNGALTYTDWFDGWTPDEPEPDEDDAPDVSLCYCTGCRIKHTSSGTPDALDPDGPLARALATPVRRNAPLCGYDAPVYAPVPHAHRWSVGRGWHSTRMIPERCVCVWCKRPAGRAVGLLCSSLKVFPRKVSDIRRRV